MMDRRTFAFTPLALCLAACGLTEDATAQASTFKAGVDYLSLSTPAPVEPVPAGKAEVVEFFGYWCPHCNAFEPTLNEWLKKAPSAMVFKRAPVSFGRANLVPLQKLYFALEALGMVEQAHSKVFAAIHIEKKINPNMSAAEMEKAIFNWAQSRNMDANKLISTMNSFAVLTKVKRVDQMVQAYGVEGVPSFGVAGKYYVDGTRAKSLTRALQIVESLAVQSATGK